MKGVARVERGRRKGKRKEGSRVLIFVRDPRLATSPFEGGRSCVALLELVLQGWQSGIEQSGRASLRHFRSSPMNRLGDRILSNGRGIEDDRDNSEI